MRIPLLGNAWNALRQRGANWMASRTPATLPISLGRRTIYIIPTGFGLFFALIVLICVAGGLNYNNNLALLFAFLFAALGSQSMLLTFRNLHGLRLSEVQAQSTFAGQPLQLTYTLEAPDHAPRTSLNLRVAGGSEQQRFELVLTPRVLVGLSQPSTRRGWLRPRFLTVWTVWPFGLFDAWSYLHPDQHVLIWPAMEPDPPPLPWGQGAASSLEHGSGDDDLRGLRAYVSGDPMRRIAWKRSAGSEDLLVRQFEAPAQPELTLDIAQLGALPWERRIERLCAWVELAWRGNLVFKLRLPDRTLGPDQGQEHRRRCLDALALLPEAAA